MLKSLLVATSLVALASLVGCAEVPAAEEEQGETESHQEVRTPGGDAAANRILDRLEEKNDQCELLNDEDRRKLNTFLGRVDWTFEAYVKFTCTVEEGQLVVGSASMETRAGWSSRDGSFTEESFDATASINVPLRLATVSAGVSTSVSVRNAGATVTHNRSTSVSVGVEKDFGVVRGSAAVSFDGSAATVSGGASVPLIINATDCAGKESVGFTVSLTAEHVDTASRAITERANDILLRYSENVDMYSSQGAFMTGDMEPGKAVCCNHFKTCD